MRSATQRGPYTVPGARRVPDFQIGFEIFKAAHLNGDHQIHVAFPRNNIAIDLWIDDAFVLFSSDSNLSAKTSMMLSVNAFSLNLNNK